MARQSGFYWFRESELDEWDGIAQYDATHNKWIWDGLSHFADDFESSFHVSDTPIDPPATVTTT